MPYYSVPRYCGIYYIPVTTSASAQPSWLPQVSLSTFSKIHDTASSTTLTQTFINPSQTSAIAKAKYAFPLYESCAVVSFRCYIGKRIIEGVVKEKEQAKAAYKEAVERGETAGLLEQHTPDVFSTSVGNIPAGETVKVVIEYLIELKHDAEIDGLRFTIPTSIAPRYGDAPSGVNVSSIPGAVDQGGMKISVQLTMPSNIRSVQSPSHHIAMHLGGHVENVPDDSFEPKHALATLSQSSTTLDKDFVLLVKCADLSFPRAFLETHPTIPNSKALMVTLVPKFALPPGVKPEIVFVADRSGSMQHRMEPLKSALRVFLKSLPVGIKFNICSFGSKHSFLWNKSKPYSAKSLEEANQHLRSMNADLGGTEILPAIKSIVSKRYEDLPLEIMVLTDGEVWNTEQLFKYVEEATSKGDIRLFSLGIGKDVSHALVEGMARVGRGFSQIVLDEKEGMEGKIVRMLRGGLSGHINDYRLEWEGKPREVDSGKAKSSSTMFDKLKKKINLFDTTANTEGPISFFGLPKFTVPSVLQAPYKLPPLFPFSRSTAYAILSGDAPAPSSLWLRGTTPSGDELSLEIPVQRMLDEGEAIHKLAARKILQELEEGTGYIHSGKYGVDKKLNPGTLDEWVQREGVRVGVKYGLASKWTSFVAVQNREAAPKGKKNLDMDTESMTVVGDDEFETTTKEEDGGSGGYGTVVASQSLQGIIKSKKPKSTHKTASRSFLLTRPDQSSQTQYKYMISGNTPAAAPVAAPAYDLSYDQDVYEEFGAPAHPSKGVKGGAFASTPGTFSAPLAKGKVGGAFSAPYPQQGYAFEEPSGPFGSAPPETFAAALANYAAASGMGTSGAAFDASRCETEDATEATPLSAPLCLPLGVSSPSGNVEASCSTKSGAPATKDKSMYASRSSQRKQGVRRFVSLSASSPVGTETQLQTPRERTTALIGLQTFEGSFLLTPALATLLDTTVTELEAKLQEFVPALTGLSEEQRKSLWATVLAVGMFERKLVGERDVWELVVEKAKTWVVGLIGEGYKDVEWSGDLVGEVLDKSKV